MAESQNPITMKIDLKSLAIGLFLGITIAFTIAATKAAVGEIGRYQITSSESNYRVLDTRTGKVWTNQSAK